jgi:hypothetical protein
VIIALAIGAATNSGDSGSGATTGAPGGPLPPLRASAPPNAARQTAACAKVLAELPVQLGRLPGRIVHTSPDTPFVVAWGDPAVVLACGAARPKSLHPGSTAQDFTNGPAGGPFYDVTSAGGANVWTTVDRGPYISITVPDAYQGGDVVPPLSLAIAKALPAVCSTDPATPDLGRLCTRRT